MNVKRQHVTTDVTAVALLRPAVLSQLEDVTLVLSLFQISTLRGRKILQADWSTPSRWASNDE